MLEIVLIIGLLLAVLGLGFLILMVVKISIREAKPNLTININQSEKKPALDEEKILELLLASKKILALEQKLKDNDD